MTEEKKDAFYWIKNLDLSPHPEGGFYKEAYRSSESIPHGALPTRFSGARSFSTSIYYLLQKGDFSAFHRICSDEGWHFYGGSPLHLHIIYNGRYRRVVIGAEVSDGHYLQYTVPAGAWFASEPSEGGEYSLVGCTVSPGFDFADFEMAGREVLTQEFPEQASLIERLTRINSCR